MQFDQDTQQRIQQAMSSGADPRQVEQLATRYQQSKAPVKPKQSFVARNLATVGGIAGGVAGSFAGPAGTIAGGAAGSALGEALRQRLGGEDDVAKIATEGALGLAGGFAGPIAGKVLGKVAGRAGAKVAQGMASNTDDVAKVIPKPTVLGGVRQKVGMKISQAGDDMALRSIGKPGNKVLTDYAKKHGEDIAKTLQKTSGVGTSPEDFAFSKVKPLQEKFNQAISQITKPVDGTKILQELDGEIAKLNKSSVASVRARAAQLQNQRDILSESVGGTGQIKASDLNAIRQEFDLNTPYSLSQSNLDLYNTNKTVSDILRKNVQALSDESDILIDGMKLKDAGRELSKLYDLTDIMASGANKGRGGAPITLQALLGGGAGGALGGPAGALAGAAATEAINSPSAARAASGFLTKAGQAVAGGGGGSMPQLPQLPGMLTGMTKRVAGPAAAQIGTRAAFGTPAPDEAGMDTMGMGMSEQPQMGMPQGMEQPGQQGVTPEEIQQLIMYDLQTTGGKGLASIKALAEYGMGGSGGGKPRTEGQAKASGFSKRIAQAEQTFQSVGDSATGIGFSIQKSLPNILKSDNAQSFEQASRNFINSVLRRESGAVISDQEFKNAQQQYLPQTGDSAAVLAQKAQNRQIVLESYQEEASAVPAGQSLPSSPQMVTF